MSWADVLYNVIVPVGSALVLSAGGICAAKLIARKAGRS
jgi:hypothetical protein